MAKVLTDEESLFLASKDGHVIHFLIEQINILSGAGKGVIGIKLDNDDVCLGGALVSNRHDALMVETSGGITKEFRRGAYPCVNRGGRGHEVVKRTDLVRVIPPAIELDRLGRERRKRRDQVQEQRQDHGTKWRWKAI